MNTIDALTLTLYFSKKKTNLIYYHAPVSGFSVK